ncbi:MAG: family 78 glycoside hydrolase catalytic domain, partial [Clostridia bacterium]|nr:family 78 glycoside hydrolase catalytic domain [Clostridia bacterium]
MYFPNKFIKATEAFTTFEHYVPSPYFRKCFEVSESARATVMISAIGFYELYINGKRITKGFFAPYISNPEDIVYYDEYTVELEKGKNVIAVQLGNGIVNNPGGYIWDFQKASFRSAPSFALSLSYTDENGNQIIIESGEDFKTAPSPIFFDDYRFGEYYDANLEIKDWNNSCLDDSVWGNAILSKAPTGEARICKADPIVITGEIKPVSIIEKDGKFIYDFGVNCAGVCRLTVKGEKGQRIELQHAEQLLDGEIDLVSVWFKRDYWERDKEIVHKDIYVCKGEGTESYMPTFTYHGFRYVEVSGITEEQATNDLLTYIVMNSDIKVCGGFVTSDKTVNTLQEMTMRSNLSNFYYFPTDCPHREKNGWSADAALSAEQMLLNLTVNKSYREWMHNICKAQRGDGAIPGIVPTSGWGFDW